MRELWSKVAERLRGLGRRLALVPADPAERALARAVRRRERLALIKSRPVTLEQRYHLLDHRELADEIFLRLKRRVADATRAREAHQRDVPLIEAGRLSPGRPYFFLKPLGKKGWLFERSGAGWIVSRAEKIVAQDLFLREGAVVDTVSLYVAADQAGFPRVRSEGLGGDLLALPVYEQRVLAEMGLTT